MKIFTIILACISLWFSAMPFSEMHTYENENKSEVVGSDCCHHDEATCTNDESSETHNDHHHNCTPQCHCKCFSPQFIINSQEIAVATKHIIAKISTYNTISFTSDFQAGIFEPPKFC